MRILILQLARFGDIYQTWPTLHALQRRYPGAEVHLLVRQRFQEASAGFTGVTLHALPTAEILRPLYEADDEAASLEGLNCFLEPLQALRFQKIINLTFSPFSSYLTDILAGEGCDVRGYTRHADGHLQIPDDTSAYFYAQVGIGRANRYHITEIFAAVAGVETEGADYSLPGVANHGARTGVVVHLGASSLEKVYPADLWVRALTAFDRAETLIFVGSEGERNLAETVISQLPGRECVPLAGHTTLHELVACIAGAKILIGADSAPVHIAALTETPVLNLSSAKVNFWETGPMSGGSRVLFAPQLEELPPHWVTEEAESMLQGTDPRHAFATRDRRGEPLRTTASGDDFSWRLIEALYTGSAFPTAETREDELAFQRLFELSELALQQIGRWATLKSRSTAATILNQVDKLLLEVVKINPRVEPVVQWFETERLRIPPGPPEDTLERTRIAFHNFNLVSKVYRQFSSRRTAAEKAIALCRECAPKMRDYAIGSAQPSFQVLVSTLHELARHSTKVGVQSWSSVLTGLNVAMERRDFVELADLLEWNLIPALEAGLNETETLAPDVIS